MQNEKYFIKFLQKRSTYSEFRDSFLKKSRCIIGIGNFKKYRKFS